MDTTLNTPLGWLARSVFTAGLVACVVLGAAGVSIEILNGFDGFLNQFNQMILFVGVASACGLACSMLSLRGARILPCVGVALALVAAVLQTIDVWTEKHSHDFRQVAWSVSILAFACGHAAALRLARLAPGLRWAMFIAQTLIAAVALLAVGRMLDLAWAPELDRWYWILVIVNLAMTTLIPFFHWSSKAYFERENALMRLMLEADLEETEPRQRRDVRIRSQRRHYDASQN
jgi:hypothetical protein